MRFRRTIVSLCQIALSLQCGSLCCAETEVRSNDILGGGAIYPWRVNSRLVNEFNSSNRGSRVVFTPKGLGNGIDALEDEKSDFVASDIPIESAGKSVRMKNILEIATSAHVIGIRYHLPSRYRNIRLSGRVLADIYQGRISRWNDPGIKALNPGTNLPGIIITPVHIDSESQDTLVFSSYLSACSEQFREKIGFGLKVSWPTTTGSRSENGANSILKDTEGSICYTEWREAKDDRAAFAAIQNRSGEFTEPSLAAGEITLDLAVQKSASMALNRTVDVVGHGAYPMVCFTFLYVRLDPDAVRYARVRSFCRFVIQHIRQAAAREGYVRIPLQVERQQLRMLGGERS